MPMAPVTRSMTEKRREDMCQTIDQGLRNARKVHGMRYKQQIVISLYEYLCENKDHLYDLFASTSYAKQFAVLVDIKVDQLKMEANDDAFSEQMETYRERLRAFIEWGYTLQ